MKTLTLPPKFRKHTLALAISSLLSMALASAHAANPPLQAGPGVDLIASGDYESNTGFALRAFGGGSIATSGLVNVLNTNTVNGVGLSIIGAGSLIDFQGGTINAKVGVQADSGARVNISNTTITASDTGILLGLPDFGPSQVYVTNSQINASATAGVVPELGVIVGIGSYFGRAYGSRVEITDSAIQASGGAGIPAVGIHGYGINIVMNGGSIVASNNGAGVMVSDGYTELNNVDISADAGGVAISGGNVGTPTDTVINGSRIISNGGSGLSISSLGVESVRTVVNDTQIVSTGPNGIGVVVGGAKNTLQLSNSTISTAGTGSSGIQVGGGAVGTAQVTLSNTDIVTTGDQADGVRASQGTILQTSGGSIQTYGANANGVYLNASYTGVGVSASMNGTAIATHGTGASGLFVSQSDMLFANASITTGGDDAPAVWAASGNTTILLGQDDVISTQGVNSDGLRSGNPLTGEAGTLTLQGGTVRVSGDAASGVQVHAGASATLLDTSVQSSGANGSALSMVGGNGAAATAQISNSTLHSTQGAAIQVGGANGGQVAIDLLNGTQVSSGIGVFLNAAAGTQTTFSMNNQVKASGDIIANGNAIVDVSLEDQSLWSGMTSTVRNMSVDSRSEWQMTDSSVVQNLNLSNAGLISFIAPVAGSYHTLTVQGDITGQNGVVALNTVLNEGGALANQHTDRLLVEGNATGTTLIEVKPTGSGAPTDLRQNGQVNADEGISIVQVGGDSHAGAFALKGGYVAAGPWQYTLHAFGPGEADPSQSLLPGGKLNWDYRLGNTFVCEGGCEPDEPEKPEEPGKPGEPEESELPHPGRIAVVPQIPSYLVAPTALFNYGSRTLDTLHQRLGELRNTAGQSDDQLGGEVFARVLGGQLKYRSDLSFNDYGYGFEQQMSTLQAGGSLVKWNAGDSTLRAGWAIDLGTTRVTPQAADGESHANYTAYGVSGWLTWQQASGLYMDAVLSGQRFSGDVSTTLRGSNVAKIHADMWTASLEVGYPFAVGKGWSVEPQAQVSRQWLNFKDFNDVDGLTTHIASAAQTAGRLGVRLAKTDEPKFAPYLRADLIRSFGARPQATVASEAWNVSETFSSGQLGASYRVGAGASSKLANNVSLYGEATYQHGTGSAGLRGWAANGGVRWNF